MKHFSVILSVVALCSFSCGNRGNTTQAECPKGFQQVISINSEKKTKADSVNFGRMRQGEVIEYQLGLKNTDTTALVILEILNNCGCTTLEYDKHPILPGDTAAITLLYDSKGQFNTQLKVIQIVTTLTQRPHNIFILAEVYK